MKSSILLAGASVIALSSGLSTAHAATTGVFGGGSTLAAKVYRDIFNCYATAADGVFATTPPNAAPVAYPTAESSSCTTQGTGAFVTLYEPVGSGAGLSAWTTATPANFGSPSSTNTIAYLDSNVTGGGSTPYPQIQFAGSDAYLNATQASQAQATVNEAVFQIPTFATPITLPVGNTQNVKLKTADICNLFAGVESTAEGVTFSELVVRSDGSGTSFIFSDWLSLNCPAGLGFNAANGFPSTTPNWAAVIAANSTGNALPLVKASGSGGIASTIANTANAIGYVSPDYVYPVVNNTAYPAYVNGFLPTVKNVQTALLHVSYPKTYNASTIGSDINNAIVTPPAKVVGYGIAGYTFIEAYSCYANSISANIGLPAQGSDLKKLVSYFYTTGNVPAILNANGFVQASSAVKTLLTSSGGPLNSTTGIQNASCPKT